MKQIIGSELLPMIECSNPTKDLWKVRWEKTFIADNLYSYIEEHFRGRPNISKIKSMIDDYYNNITTEKILNGFTFKDYKVYLSTVNQINYKSICDAANLDSSILPIKFKFIDKDDNNYYYQFRSVNSLNDFYTKMISYINSTIKSGWELKDSIDYSVYE